MAQSDAILQRMREQATMLGEHPDLFIDSPYPGVPRWRLDAQWIEFECGCRAERCTQLHGAEPYDPIVFRDLPEQGVYDHVCWQHAPAMNKRMHFGGFVDFGQWHRARRARLMGKVK